MGIGANKNFISIKKTFTSINNFLSIKKKLIADFLGESTNPECFFDAWASTLYPGRNERRKE